MNNAGNSGPQPIPPEAGANNPIPAESKPAGGPAPVSRAPLSLGGSGAPVAGPARTPAAVPRGAAPGPKPVPLRPVAAVYGNERICGCKTFFTKLHPGAIDFMDEQITQWLKDNPGVVIKATSAVTGEIQAKKTEPNILLTVWYCGQVTGKSASHMG